MKLCKYCGEKMRDEYETNAQNNQKYKGFFTCPNCGAMCDGEYIVKGNEKHTLSEKWIKL